MADEASPEERAAMARLLAERPGLGPRIAQLQEGLGEQAGRVSSGRAQERLAQLKAEHLSTRPRHTGAIKVPGAHRRRVISYALGAAVAVIGIALLPSAMSFVRGDQERAPFVQERERLYATQRAQRAIITLPDQSQVALAPDTRLRFSMSASGDRVLDLSGEAFFTVTHRTSRAFIVRSDYVTARVLGTAFHVRTYPKDSVIQVGVVSGRVAVETKGNATILTPGMVGMVDDSSAVIHQGIPPEDIAAWRQGHLVFKATPVPVMLETVGQWYGYSFTIADSVLKTRHVSAVLSVDNPAEAMRMIQAMLGVTMTFKGTIVTLHPKLRQTTSPAGPVTRYQRDSFLTSTRRSGR